jgi:hypothetical protein
MATRSAYVHFGLPGAPNTAAGGNLLPDTLQGDES